jgi:hypothetical protein
MQILLIKSRCLAPKMLTNMQISMTAQNANTVCHSFGTKSSFQRVMADRISCPPLKLIDSVTVQFPTSVSQPVTQEVMGAHSRVDSMALQ